MLTVPSARHSSAKPFVFSSRRALCHAFTPAFLCFQRFADSFCKYRGVRGVARLRLTLASLLPPLGFGLTLLDSAVPETPGAPCSYSLPILASLLFALVLGLGQPLPAALSSQNQPLLTTSALQVEIAAPATQPLDPVLAKAHALLDRDPTEAEHILRAYVAEHPDSADAHFLLGTALFRQTQQDARTASKSAAASRQLKIKASLAEFTEGAKYRRPSAADLKIVALDYVLLNDYANADKWLTKMIEWAPDDAEAWYLLGRTKYNENRFAEAIQAFQRCLKLEPNNVKAEDNLGLSYAGLGRNEEAMAAYQNAIAWQQDAPVKSSGPYIDMASLLLDLNKADEAVSYLHQAVKISTADSKAHELLGKAYARMERFPEAQRELEKAIQLSPETASLHCMLGPIYRRQGLPDKAKIALDRCAALSGTHSVQETPRP
jgi:tetratricopeptide (TPR) repeat protein